MKNLLDSHHYKIKKLFSQFFQRKERNEQTSKWRNYIVAFPGLVCPDHRRTIAGAILILWALWRRHPTHFSVKIFLNVNYILSHLLNI